MENLLVDAMYRELFIQKCQSIVIKILESEGATKNLKIV
jgi:hypothetical protein